VTLVSKHLFNESSISEERDITINKGHFHLETPERIEAFSQKLAEGWEAQYSEYRRLWQELPEKRKIRDYPLLVDFELSRVCNLSCPMCPTKTARFRNKVKQGFMDIQLFKKIIKEISGKVYAIRLSLLGESTLHKGLIDVITHAKQQHIKEVSFLTNGSCLNMGFFKKLVNSGVDWITISIDGLEEEYNKIRKPLIFSETLANLNAIHDYKAKHGLAKPFIKVQGVWPAIRPKPEEYYNTIAPLVDLVAYNPLIDYLQKDKDIIYNENFSCPQIYQRMCVGFDGLVVLCANNSYFDVVVGDANSQTIHEIWHGKKLNQYRKIHSAKKGYLNIELCKICYYPRSTTQEEKAYVNGREIRIENYINRKQTIDE